MQDFDRNRQKNVFVNHAHPLYPIWLSTRDMARIGLLMSYHGKWGDKQIANGDFLSWSTNLITPSAELNPTPFRTVAFPSRWGYVRLWWVWDAPFYPGNTSTGPYQGAYAAMGTGGQFITVFPAMDLVVAHKVDIDAHPEAGISPLGYDVALDILLDAKCASACK